MFKKLFFLSAFALIGATACAWTPDIPREDLSAEYLAQPSDLVKVEDAILHVRDTGPREASPVILIHGFGSSLHTWEDWATVLEQDYRVIRFDMPGAGLSPPDPQRDYTDARVIALLASLMDQNGIERATLIGNSIGGRIAWTMASAYPERVEKLVLVSPDGFASPSFGYGEATKAPAILHASKYFLPRWALRPNLEVAYADPDKLSDNTVERYHDLLLARGNRGALIDRIEQTILTDPVPRLKAIDAPVLLLWGQEDGLIPVTNSQDYLDALPNARLVTLPGVGHLPMEEAPKQSIVPVLEFLSEATRVPEADDAGTLSN